MNRLLIATLTILLVLSTVPAMGQRWVERNSTESDRDLDRVSFAGEITSIDGQVACIRTDDGETMYVHLGPRWYWHERGYRLRTGIHVEVSGWFDDEDESSCYAGYISGDGFHFELSDSDGYPLWLQDNDRGDNWQPRHNIVFDYYWNPPPRPPVWWHAPRYNYWGDHWRPYGRPRYHHDGPRWGGPGHGGPRHDGPGWGGPGHDGPRHDGPGWGGPGHDGPRHDRPRDDGGRRHRGGRRGD
jgi:hypothetical protein